MFNIGDRIFYPAHGVGIIDNIEEKNLNGIIQHYYSIHMINNNMNLIIPVICADNNNMRLICDSDTMNCKLNCKYSYEDEFKKIIGFNYKIRKEKFMNRILQGKVEDYLKVIKMLTKLKKYHNLNINEHQILYKAKKILSEEICVSMNITKEEAERLLKEKIDL